MSFDTQYIIIRVIVWEPIFAVTIVPFRASTVKGLGSNGGDSFFFFGWRIRTVLPTFRSLVFECCRLSAYPFIFSFFSKSRWRNEL